MSANKQAFIKLFKETARYHHRYEVFRDVITCQAYAIHNAVDFNQKVEDDYLRIAKRYVKEDLNRMAKLMAYVVMGLEEKPCDFLGSLFMELELGSSQIGQFFTPYELSLLMAQLNVSDIEDKPVITLHEPAVGSGGMVIAYAQALREKGVNYQQRLWVQAIDLDPVAAMMAYIQFTLLHIPAEICIGNTLTMDISRVFRTPAYYFGAWEQKLKMHYAIKEFAVLLGSDEDKKPTAMPIEQFDLLRKSA
ncbi:SAM-dependent DNA methyltransferase [Shewanella baltica]|uniref:N-6 DNA methylase n=1 Tax=Shewanella baltica TaxID=62322 RepID=UPI00217DD1A2|nr:N-6 DNA methylase [Shewanella baltica]MCS6271847.1 SAM-dependent DNA methyltransferase [Shewanella baltica]